MVFTFDGDAAGQKAALRAFEDDQKFAAQTSIAISPGGMDPCELRLAKGDAAVRELVDDCTPLFEFAIRSVVAGTTPGHPRGAGRGAGGDRADRGPHQGPAIRHEYAVMLSGLLGTSRQPVRGRAASPSSPVGSGTAGSAAAPRSPRRAPAHAPGARRARRTQRPARPPPRPAQPAHRVERELLKLALQHPQLVSPAFDAYGEDEFTGAALRRRAPRHRRGRRRSLPPTPDYLTRIRDGAPDDQVRTLVTELAVEPVLHKAPDLYAGQVLVEVRLFAVKRREAELRAGFARLGPAPRPGTGRRRAERAVGPPAVRPAAARPGRGRPLNPPGCRPCEENRSVAGRFR